MPLGEPEGGFPFLGSLLERFESREVSVAEIEMIPVLLRQGWLQREVNRRLGGLDPGNAEHAAFLRLVDDAVSLLVAVDRGVFEPGPGWTDLARRLCRALAYVIRDGDAIPDHLPGGLRDDRRELEDWKVRAEAELVRFEIWRSRQV